MQAHLDKNPDAKIISLGIGDTTEPIPGPIVDGMKASAEGLGTLEGYGKYGGYGAEAGSMVHSFRSVLFCSFVWFVGPFVGPFIGPFIGPFVHSFVLFCSVLFCSVRLSVRL